MSAFPDYYTMLGVAVDAPPTMIKTAFKKLALQYHPDVYKGDDAQERMRVLLEAYRILNDPEERRKYDARRSEHIQDGHVYRQSASDYQRAASGSTRTRTTVTPGARRDRQRHYAFPDFHEGRSVSIDLLNFTYVLSSADAHTLQHEGVLRGVAPGNEDYYCHRCSHHWKSTSSDQKQLPALCPNCKATDWSEYLLLRCIHCAAVFESEQIRYEVGSINYGKGHQVGEAELCPPYELFPLCPYCGTARWCPAEDARVSALRIQMARRAAAVRVIWISVVVVLMLGVGLVAFMFH